MRFLVSRYAPARNDGDIFENDGFNRVELAEIIVPGGMNIKIIQDYSIG